MVDKINMKILNCYTDGACSGNPGPGGYGVVIMQSENPPVILETFSEQCPRTTNNREELKAILYVLRKAKNDPNNYYRVISDSSYAINSITNWMVRWAAAGWVNSKGRPVENKDLMQELYKYCNIPNVEFIKVNGHSGIIGNEYADALATNNLKKQTLICNSIKNML